MNSRVPDSDDEEDEDFLDNSSPALLVLDPSAANDVEIIDDPTLDAIGEQIQQIETEIRQEHEAKLAHWKKSIVPDIKVSMQKTEERISALKAQLKSDPSRDDNKVLGMKIELKELRDHLDLIKRELYFPENLESFGSDGLYFGYDHLWLQDVSGAFNLEVEPPMGTDTGKIILVLKGGRALPSYDV
jgi:hypothetical protein